MYTAGQIIKLINIFTSGVLFFVHYFGERGHSSLSRCSSFEHSVRPSFLIIGTPWLSTSVLRTPVHELVMEATAWGNITNYSQCGFMRFTCLIIFSWTRRMPANNQIQKCLTQCLLQGEFNCGVSRFRANAIDVSKLHWAFGAVIDWRIAIFSGRWWN